MKNFVATCSLLLLAVSILHAEYSPNQLFIKLRTPVRTSALDGQLSTSSASINTLLESGASGDLPFQEFTEISQSLDRVMRLQFSGAPDLQTLSTQIRLDDAVEWVAFNNHYSTGQSLDEPYVPNDSLYPEAWWLEKISAGLAWELSRGDSSIIIGIIDTGVEYTHHDLRENIWRNNGEIPDNGVDDDNNGFTDDVVGWDFVDAPGLPSGGDYLERDNDPMDDFGHGTYVAGCASAASDNGACYPSIGFHCRIMPLRAGNANGSLEEDDIAAALLYGAANGAAIVNMSFGDVVASPLLREVVAIVHSAGVVMVASAGNGSSDGIHYPSGFSEVISVGATDRFDRLAGFSNLGPTVDIVAPGDHIGSTMLGDSCGEWIFPSGTSYASPIVAGVCGLLLSVNRELTPADVVDILKASADDLGAAGWDSIMVNGRVNARRAVESAAFGADAEARIFFPGIDAGVRGSFSVIGNAQGTAFSDYTLEYGIGENPNSWTFIASGDHRVLSDTLGIISAPLIDTVLVVRLTVRATTQHLSIDMAHLYAQNASPVIDSMKTRLVLDGPGYGQQITAWSNQIGRASLLMTNTIGDSIREDFGYVNDEHVAVISQNRYPGEWQAVLQITNLIGEVARTAPFAYSSVQSGIRPYLYNSFTTALPHGVIGNFVSDYDCDGFSEVWLLPVDERNLVDTLEPYEWNGSDFIETENTYGPHIPQCYGDADGDGLMEMGARRFTESRIWEQTDSCGVLNNIVFSSPEIYSEFLISRFVRIDSATGRDDVLARIAVGSSSRLALFRVSENYELTLRDTLPNLSEGLNSLGPPTSAVGDVDHDGKIDIFFGDYDGDLIWCEWTGSEMAQVWSTRLRQNDATSWMAIGDCDCDGEDELVAGCRSNAGASSESQRLLQGWDYYVYESLNDNQLSVVDSIAILGNENVSFNPASVSAVDVNADDCAEILISAYPDLYVISRNGLTGNYEPEWHYFPSKANAVVAHDLNGNGISEFLMADGEHHLRIENAVAISNSPFPPVLSGNPENETTVSLRWTRVIGAVHYELYYAPLDGPFQLLSEIVDTSFTWDQAQVDIAQRFVVATYDTAFEQPISIMSNIVTLISNSPPTTNDSAVVVAPKTVEVRFNEPMSSSVFVQGNWRLADGTMPAVIAESEGTRVLYLVFDARLQPGEYQLNLRNLRDAQGTPLPIQESMVVFRVRESESLPPFVLTHRIVDSPVGHRVEIEFSEPMSPEAIEPHNYMVLDPRLNLVPYDARQVVALGGTNTKYQIELDPHYPVGAIGVEVRIQIAEMHSLSGSLLNEASLLLGQRAENLNNAFVFPNPYRGIGAAGTDGVFFASLPQTATIRIFSLDGALLLKLDHNSPTGHAMWDLRTKNGEKVASGIYVYSIESDGAEVMGKIAVIR